MKLIETASRTYRDGIADMILREVDWFTQSAPLSDDRTLVVAESPMSAQSADSFFRKLKYVDPAEFTPHFAWKRAARRIQTSEEVVCEGVSLEVRC